MRGGRLETDSKKPFGFELIVDLCECRNIPCTREFLTEFFKDLCERINMERADLHFWDYDGYPEEYDAAEDHLKGISAVQFIMTSSIVVHTLDVPRAVYLNVFSCRPFDPKTVEEFCALHFGGRVAQRRAMERGPG